MTLLRALQLNSAMLTLLACGVVALGEPAQPQVPLTAALAALVALAVTDVGGWLRLPRTVGNLVAVVAVVFSLAGFLDKSSEDQLITIAHMLCYLQIVLSLQDKTRRIFWQLLVLGVLQIVVAAALDLGPHFALLLGLYAPLALAMLVLLCLDQAATLATQAAGSAAAARPETPPASSAARALALVQARLRVLPASTTAAGDWPMAPRVVARQVGLLVAATLPFAVVFFYVTPRFSDSPWMGSRFGAGGYSGFQPEVRLAERGQVHLSSQTVMRVALWHRSDRRPVAMVEDPYFQGAVLVDYLYDQQGGRWLPAPMPRVRGGRGEGPPLALTASSLVVQDLVLEPSISHRVFAIMPTVPISGGSSDIGSLAPGLRLEPAAGLIPRQYRVSLATPAIRSGRQLRAVPSPNRLETDLDIYRHEVELYDALVIDRSRFPRLIEKAATILAQQRLTDAPALSRALALERHFHVPGEYRYSLSLNVPRQPQLDPIEDFVANHRTGHCEYFASALVLMLRSQGIPARMVVGYKGGNYNAVGRYYVVQQRHAHAWVEAWLPSEEVPPLEVAGVPSHGGAWYRLDPTPGRETFVASREEGWSQPLLQAFDYCELLWRDYVLGLNRRQQEEMVFEPLTAQTTVLPSWVESRSVQRWLRRWGGRLGWEFSFGGPPREGRGRAFEGALAMLVTVGLLVVLGGVQVVRLVGHRWADWHCRRRLGRYAVSQAPAFYRRLERLLAARGMVRRSGQTPRELAEAARQALEGSQTPRPLAAIPPWIVACYYRVRFGAARLDNSQAEAIEQALSDLGQALGRRKRP
jgi:transglutaminase-like putative cysteine protease